MIIGINGYIGSGKDTIGTIIQYLVDKERGFSNGHKWDKFQQWNKDVDILQAEEWSGWEIKKFAYKLKQIASILTGIPQEKFEDQEFKKTYLGEEWSSFPKSKAENLEDYKKEFESSLIWGKSKLSVREFLQKLGTDAIRDGLHPNTWVNALMSDYIDANNPFNFEKDPKSPYPLEEKFPNWIVTDVRFPNEAQAIKDREGIIIRVNRTFDRTLRGFKDECGPASLNMYEQARVKHASETSLDDWKFDYVIDNNGTIEELIEKVRDILKDLKII